MNKDSDRVRRMGIAPGNGRGPVRLEEDEADIQVVTLVGEEESDLLHAAADWVSEHPMAIVHGLNFADINTVAGDVGDDGMADSLMPKQILKMTVDLFGERN